MQDYYQKKYKSYNEKTFAIDPSEFLSPLVERLTAGAIVLDVGCGSGFDSHGFKVCDFSRSASKTGSGEVWLGYVLEKKKNRYNAVDETFYDAIKI